MNSSFRWPTPWEAAVSLTYDDGLPVHTEVVAPLLQQHGLRGTFYVPAFSDLGDHPDVWRRLAHDGHELGNHSLFHPCRRSPPEQYAWLDPTYDLADYSPARLRDELAAANLLLRLIDGKQERSLGTTCGHTTIGRGQHEQPIQPIITDLFVAARGGINGELAQPDRGVDLLDVGCISADGRTLAELQEVVERARAQRSWAVLMTHGIGSESHHLYLDPDVHAQFIAWLAEQKGVWVAPFVEVASYIAGQAGS